MKTNKLYIVLKPFMVSTLKVTPITQKTIDETELRSMGADDRILSFLVEGESIKAIEE